MVPDRKVKAANGSDINKARIGKVIANWQMSFEFRSYENLPNYELLKIKIPFFDQS